MTSFLELGNADLTQPLQQLIEGLAWVNVRGIGTIPNDAFMHGLVTIDPTLTSLEVVEKSFLVVVRGGQVAHAKTGERSPPAIADRLDQMVGQGRILGIVGGVLRESDQERFDLPFDLGLTELTGIILHSQELSQFDQPVQLTTKTTSHRQVSTVPLRRG